MAWNRKGKIIEKFFRFFNFCKISFVVISNKKKDYLIIIRSIIYKKIKIIMDVSNYFVISNKFLFHGNDSSNLFIVKNIKFKT